MITAFVALSDHRMHFCLGKTEGKFSLVLVNVALVTDLFELAQGPAVPVPTAL